MKVPFLDLKKNYAQVKDEIQQEINWVLENTAYVMGKPVFEFEKAFAEAINVKHVIGTSSGTDGNHLVLWALGIGQGDEVIIPANTFIATAWGATLCGAKPVFVDCHPQSYNIDPEKVEAAITPKTKAIVAVHLYGQPADMDALKTIADKHNLFLVEDAAQAHLAEYSSREIVNTKNGQNIDNISGNEKNKEIISRDKWQKVGSLGIAASFSFYPGKNLGAYGEAGAVATNDDILAQKFKMIRDHGAENKYYHKMFGHNYRMEAIQGAVLGVKLKYLSKWNEQRRRAAQKYRTLLKDVEQIILPNEMDYAKHVYHLFVIQVKAKDSQNRSEVRDALQEFLKSKEIATGLHYPVPLHLQECFKDLGYKKGDFPVTEQLAEQGLSLPIFPEITDEQIEYVADSIKEFFKK